MQNWAVFTGDIVRSGDLEPDALAQVFGALETAAQSIDDWPEGYSAFSRFRGDGWQMALPVHYALRGALTLRAAVRCTGKGRDTRIGIGIGAGSLKDGDLAAADGPAFVASGRALDAINRGPRMSAPDAPAVLRVALPLADIIAQEWTAKQAQVVQLLLAPAPPTQDELGHALGRSRQMIQKQANAAGVAGLIESCEAYEGAK